LRYYFNFEDGETALDDEGMEFADFNDVKTEALRSVVDLLRDIRGPKFWLGTGCRVWVTDQPSGGGNTQLTLNVSAKLPA